MLSHPREELAQIPLRLRYLHGGDSWWLKWVGKADRDPETDRRTRIMISLEADRFWVALADGAYLALLVVAAIGLVPATRSKDPATWPIPAILVYFHVLHGILFFGSSRFHVPFVSLLAVLAATAICRAGTIWPVAASRPREPAPHI
jgi:hypothetical protein